ncbi:M15 family metallopeptidase [Paenibacillus sp. P3E]|uniref:M15 family metallopeptidase n=1 Tax=Paenibacillus sp. P3E TaxID=1349435 RepID=UPI0021163EDA|nr:M15 family metallopeptidase [Paenibacillus sp. P3E]
MEQVKAKSAKRLDGLQPVVKAAATALIERCYARVVNIVITQGLRTIPEQNDLFAQGRTQDELNKAGLSHVKAKPSMQKVTNARGGYSNHNFGWAIDFALLLPDERTVSWDTLRDGDKDSLPDWSEVVEEAKALGFEWGGEWRTFTDLPHLQMVFGLTTTQLRIGRVPTAVQVQATYAVINKVQEEADELSQAEKQELAALQSEVKNLTAVVEGLTKSKDVLKDQALEQATEIKELKTAVMELTDTTPPAWSLEAIQALHDTPSVLNGQPVIDTPDKATKSEARLFTVLHRLGLTARLKGNK